jgi:hypothetical protein
MAAQEEGPLPGTGPPDQAGRVGVAAGTPAQAGRGQRWLARWHSQPVPPRCWC